ncbi:MAG: hypothetical protein GXP22_02920 [Gammaproteobacteria bacterium]|nr:hypothetical protein [Gammaproteobacteria bacterium]
MFRVIIGLWIVVGLYIPSMDVIYALVVVLLFEGLTNFRVPAMISRLRYGADTLVNDPNACGNCFSFEAERALRFIIAVFIFASTLPIAEVIWWFPWFIGFALMGAGLSGICPIVLSLRWVGFK